MRITRPIFFALGVAAPLAVLVVGVVAFLHRQSGEGGRSSPEAASIVSRAAFDRWLAAESSRAEEFLAFTAFLRRADVVDVVPAWTLLRANANKSAGCRAEPFILPPRRLWPQIVPALRLVKTSVIPAVGRVSVASTFRLPALNSCSNGASRSRHLTFAAIDLVPLEQPDAATSFRRLCAAWRGAGPSSRWGLGAYIDPRRPALNRVGRFHVDATSWRSWGFSYHRSSSGCATAHTASA